MLKLKSKNNTASFAHPRYWPLKVGIFLARAIVSLPVCIKRPFAYFVGWLGYYVAPRRRNIASQNLKACFPTWTEKEHQAQLKKVLYSTALGLFETGFIWLSSVKQLDKVKVTYKGLEYIEAAKQSGRGILVCGAHFTSLEFLGLFLAKHDPGYLVYQRHRNPYMEHIMVAGRSYNKGFIERRDVKAMVRHLKAGETVFYAPDQDFGRKPSVFAPFFGVQAATLSVISRMLQSTGAIIVPVRCKQIKAFEHYEIEYYPPFDNYPSDNRLQDATIYNNWLMACLSNQIDQYLWVHRRFKTRPEGESPFYKG